MPPKATAIHLVHLKAATTILSQAKDPTGDMVDTDMEQEETSRQVISEEILTEDSAVLVNNLDMEIMAKDKVLPSMAAIANILSIRDSQTRQDITKGEVTNNSI